MQLRAHDHLTIIGRFQCCKWVCFHDGKGNQTLFFMQCCIHASRCQKKVSHHSYIGQSNRQTRLFLWRWELANWCTSLVILLSCTKQAHRQTSEWNTESRICASDSISKYSSDQTLCVCVRVRAAAQSIYSICILPLWIPVSTGSPRAWWVKDTNSQTRFIGVIVFILSSYYPLTLTETHLKVVVFFFHCPTCFFL